MSYRKALQFWNQCGTLEILDNDKNEEICELETSKISKVLDRISEVMNWIKRYSDLSPPSFTFAKH
jgi:hypothetical protein